MVYIVMESVLRGISACSWLILVLKKVDVQAIGITGQIRYFQAITEAFNPAQREKRSNARNEDDADAMQNADLYM